MEPIRPELCNRGYATIPIQELYDMKHKNPTEFNRRFEEIRSLYFNDENAPECIRELYTIYNNANLMPPPPRFLNSVKGFFGIKSKGGRRSRKHRKANRKQKSKTQKRR
jgi:hypothetical protein